MTIYYPQIEDSFGFRCIGSSGVSDVATRVEQAVEESLYHYLESRLEVLVPEIVNLLGVSDGTSIPVDENTVIAALQFAHSLPRFGPMPEVSADPDGEVSFDWFGPSGEMFSVSVNKNKRLAYAGWFGETSRIHGMEKLAEGCPPQIIRGIQKATR